MRPGWRRDHGGDDGGYIARLRVVVWDLDGREASRAFQRGPADFESACFACSWNESAFACGWAVVGGGMSRCRREWPTGKDWRLVSRYRQDCGSRAFCRKSDGQESA